MEKQEIFNVVLMGMQGKLSNRQLGDLKSCLFLAFKNVELVDKCTDLFVQDADEVNIQFLRKFEVEMRVNDLSEGTINHYIRETRKFLERVNKQFSQVTKDDIIIYLAELTQRGLSKNTVDNTRKYIKSFFSWLEYNDYIVKSPFNKLKCTKRESIKKEILTESEVEMMRDACETPRELAVFDLLNSTGMRVSECVALNVDDVDFITGKINIYAQKTKTYREGYLDPKALKHIGDYRNYLADKCEESDGLFSNIRKTKGRYRRIKNSTVEDILKTLSERSGIQKRITVHTIRKTFACRLHRKGVPPMVIAALLGHADFSTSAKYYIKLSEGELRNEFERAMV